MNDLRKQIDKIDETIIELLAKRMEVVKKIGEVKKKIMAAPLDDRRWTEVISKLKKSAENKKLSPELVEKIYELIHEESLKAQNRG